jgi:hypothetical protein
MLPGVQQQAQQAQQQVPGPSGGGGEGGGEVLQPVECGGCGTEVGLRDSEWVYHFFNVFASSA